MWDTFSVGQILKCLDRRARAHKKICFMHSSTSRFQRGFVNAGSLQGWDLRFRKVPVQLCSLSCRNQPRKGFVCRATVHAGARLQSQLTTNWSLHQMKTGKVYAPLSSSSKSYKFGLIFADKKTSFQVTICNGKLNVGCCFMSRWAVFPLNFSQNEMQCISHVLEKKK